MVVVSESENENESKFSVREFSVKQLFRKLTCRMVTHGDPSDKPYRACSAPLAPPIPPRAGGVVILCSHALSIFHSSINLKGGTLLVLTGLCTLPAPDFLQDLIKGVLSEKAIGQNANGCRMTMLILDVLVLGWLESPCAEYQHHARPSKTWILESSSSEVPHVDGLKTFENIRMLETTA